MLNYTLTVNSQKGAVTLPLTQEQFIHLLDGDSKVNPMSFSLNAIGVAEAEIQVDEATRAAIIATSVNLGDYVTLREKQDNGETTDVLYQYIVSPDGKRGLLRASRLGSDRRFDKDGSNSYAKSSLKKFVDEWAEGQNFAFTSNVSLLELPRTDYSDEAYVENRDYVLSLRLSKDLGWFWTKTAYSGSASSVWLVNAYNATNSVNASYANNYYGVSPVLWLSSEVLIGGGQGTRDNPHNIVSE
jgi:hypothetical protein